VGFAAAVRRQPVGLATTKQGRTMCLGIPGQVVEFVDDDRQLARVDVAGVKRTIHVGLVLPEGLEPGDWVLIHVGFALSRIDEEEARKTIAFLEQITEEYEAELDELSRSRIE
jgi:hydrogenase expression/formation protein HypC